jgi:hypothetical protein
MALDDLLCGDEGASLSPCWMRFCIRVKES